MLTGATVPPPPVAPIPAPPKPPPPPPVAPIEPPREAPPVDPSPEPPPVGGEPPPEAPPPIDVPWPPPPKPGAGAPPPSAGAPPVSPGQQRKAELAARGLGMLIIKAQAWLRERGVPFTLPDWLITEVWQESAVRTLSRIDALAAVPDEDLDALITAVPLVHSAYFVWQVKKLDAANVIDAQSRPVDHKPPPKAPPAAEPEPELRTEPEPPIEPGAKI